MRENRKGKYPFGKWAKVLIVQKEEWKGYHGFKFIFRSPDGQVVVEPGSSPNSLR